MMKKENEIMEEFFNSPRTERYVRMMEESTKCTEYLTYPLSDGMLLMYHKNWHDNKERLLINTQRELVYDLVDAEGRFTLITKEDIDFKGIIHLNNIRNAYLLKVEHEFEISQFTDGLALVRWQLFPDSHWYDDQGMGVTGNQETSIYAYIDCFANLLTKFTDMHLDNQKKINRKLANQQRHSNNYKDNEESERKG